MKNSKTKAALGLAGALALGAFAITQTQAQFSDTINTSVSARGYTVDITLNGSDPTTSAPIDLSPGLVLDSGESSNPINVELKNKGKDPVQVVPTITSPGLELKLTSPTGVALTSGTVAAPKTLAPIRIESGASYKMAAVVTMPSTATQDAAYTSALSFTAVKPSS